MSGEEARLVQELREVAETCGAFLAVVGQRNASKSGSTLGVPDLILMDSGRVELIEVKRPKTAEHPRGYLNLGQQAFCERAAEHGVRVHVVDSVDDFIGVLNGCRKPRGVRRAR